MTSFSMIEPAVTVIIPFFNDARRLDRCLSAIEEGSYPASQIIAVDNGSTEDVAPVKAAHPNVTWMEEPKPGSYAARNRGLAEATGEVLAFTDSDCLPHRDWLRRGIEAMSRIGPEAYVGGAVKIAFEDPDRPTVFEIYDDLFAFPQESYLRRSGFAVTANLFVTRAVVDRVGPFDDSVRSGGDYAWGNRVEAAGVPMAFAADALVFHPARGSLVEQRKKLDRTVRGSAELATRAGWRPRLRLILPPVPALLAELGAVWRCREPYMKGKRLRVCRLILKLKLFAYGRRLRYSSGFRAATR